MPDPQKSGPVRPALATAVVSIAFGWGLCAAVILLSGGRDLRSAAYAWLVLHGSGITIGDSVIRLVPLGATALCVAWVVLIARRYATSGMGDLGPYVGIVAAVYGTAAAILAAVTVTGDVTISIPRAAMGGFVVGGLGSALGAGWQHRHSWPVSPDVLLVLRGAVRAVGVVLVTSLVLVLALLAIHGERAGELWGMLNPGILGGVALAGACLLSLPTLVLWTASVLLGPGFQIGTDTSVDLAGAYLGAIPGLPTLAAVPPPGQFHPMVMVLAAIVPAAGIWAGMVSARVRIGTLAGALGGMLLGVVIGLSGGGIGPGRMVEAGPPPVTPLVIAVPALALCGALGSWAFGLWSGHYGGARGSLDRRPRVRNGDEPSGAH